MRPTSRMILWIHPMFLCSNKTSPYFLNILITIKWPSNFDALMQCNNVAIPRHSFLTLMWPREEWGPVMRVFLNTLWWFFFLKEHSELHTFISSKIWFLGENYSILTMQLHFVISTRVLLAKHTQVYDVRAARKLKCFVHGAKISLQPTL